MAVPSSGFLTVWRKETCRVWPFSVKLKEGDGVHLFVTYKHDPFGLDKGPTTHQFGCDVKENTDTRLVVDFPKSRVLTPDVAIGQPGQVARFEFSAETKKGKQHHGRRADVIFVA